MVKGKVIGRYGTYEKRVIGTDLNSVNAHFRNINQSKSYKSKGPRFIYCYPVILFPIIEYRQ